MRFAAICILATIGLAGCEPNSTDTMPDTTPNTKPDTTPGVKPDNTDINERDASGETKTPIDQNENQADINTTAEIRKRIVAHEGMSINGQNAKVMTANGKVTLRGPVESQTEWDTIDRIAREVAGDDNVDNQLEVNNP